MTSDIEKWANTISSLYGNISKPVLDIALLIFYLSKSVGWFYFMFFCWINFIRKGLIVVLL